MYAVMTELLTTGSQWTEYQGSLVNEYPIFSFRPFILFIFNI